MQENSFHMKMSNRKVSRSNPKYQKDFLRHRIKLTSQNELKKIKKIIQNMKEHHKSKSENSKLSEEKLEN